MPMMLDQPALEALAGNLSLFARPGMAILLKGDLGSGKSTFARAFIRALAPPDASFDIPSPTFTLAQSYAETRTPVLHADLYRLSSGHEIAELGLDDQLDSHVVIVEWPEKMLDRPWTDVLLVALSGAGGSREVQMDARGVWAEALARNSAIEKFLSGTRWRNAGRRFLEGDASFRRYETLSSETGHAVLMDMPARPDGPVVKDGLPYSAIAHLSEDIRAVIAINAELGRRGYSVPATEACDLERGFAVIEDLGRKVYGRMIQSGEDVGEPMREAVAVLARMAEEEWPAEVPLAERATYRLHPYDIRAQMIEADLLASWFWPHAYGREIEAELRAEYGALWLDLLPLTQPARRVWTLRDYHSPNLLWLPERVGIKRVGLIDTQDAVLGHPAYDLASMLQDARVDIAFAWADELFEHYCSLRPGFGREEFETAYAILGAQRAAKILGIFARLSKRDGKHGYLRHMPRVSRYLERGLQHPRMSGLKAWFEKHLPASVRERAP